MARVIAAHHGDAAAVARLAAAVEHANPGYSLAAGVWSGEGDLAPAARGVRYLWVLDGDAAAWLPDGHRTQEGDGAPLASDYQADPFPPAGDAHLAALRREVETAHPAVVEPLRALCARSRDGVYRGDVAGDLWRLLESGLEPHEWVDSDAARHAVEWFFEHAREIGWSTRARAGWEPLMTGDQVVCAPALPVRLRGRFRYWLIDDTGAPAGAPLPCGAVRRLRHLRDTAGGCSPGFDAFRRLNVTWLPTQHDLERVSSSLHGAASPSSNRDSSPEADAPNRLNSHVLHIEAAQSRTHYHPATALPAGRPQSEFYFSLDPRAYRLRQPPGIRPRLVAFPDVHDWARFDVVECAPGLAVFIPPDTGHRGIDVFANVVTIPGFKPGNELYADHLIRNYGAGAPYNATLARGVGASPVDAAV